MLKKDDRKEDYAQYNSCTIFLTKVKQNLRYFVVKFFRKLPFILGIMMLCGGIYLQYSVNIFFKTAVETTATITNIESYYSGGDVMYDVYIDYTINGYEYHSKYDLYYTGMNIGQEVVTYYNPDNPYENKSKSSNYNGFYLMGFAVIWMFIIYKIMKRK